MAIKNQPEPDVTDVVIVGAGPTALFAVFTCGMLGLSCHLVDPLAAPGGQLTALYPEKPIYDVPGYPKITAGDLVAQLVAQAAPFDPVYHLGQQVRAVSQTGQGRWRVETDQARVVTASAVIIAAGAGAFGPKRPPLDRLAEFEGTSVFYMVTRREDFRGRNVVIAGGGDSAVDWAVSLAELAQSVTLVHRRAKFRAAPGMVDQLHHLADGRAVRLMTPFQLTGLEGRGGQLDAVIVRDLDGKTERLEADALLAFYGLHMDLGPIAQWGLGLDKQHIVVDPTTLQTNRAGIFAVGDVATYPNKLKLIVTGFSEAAMAARAIYPIVRPGESLHVGHSTSTGVPKITKE